MSPEACEGLCGLCGRCCSPVGASLNTEAFAVRLRGPLHVSEAFVRWTLLMGWWLGRCSQCMSSGSYVVSVTHLVVIREN